MYFEEVSEPELAINKFQRNAGIGGWYYWLKGRNFWLKVQKSWAERQEGPN
jgi:hypothetical protein